MVWPLTGRERELELIAAARADRECRGAVLVADAGVGKSRLAREAQLAAEAGGAHGEWVQATRSAAAVPLAAFTWLVPDDAGSDDVIGLLRNSARALGQRAGGKRVVLVVDDAHLLDQVSAALVLHLASTGAAFVIATVRAGEPAPDAIRSLWKDAGARRIELEPLPDETVRSLVERALGDPVQEAALRWVVEVGQGNALFVRELVTGAVDAGALVHARDFWRLHGVPPASASLVELVEDRMVGMSGEQRAPVELLALGEPLRLSEVAALTTHEALLDAETAGLLAVDGDELRLAHPLYGEVIRAQLPPLRAGGLRLRLADVLEARVPFEPADALRVARLRLDAGAALTVELALAAARAANLAGDPELGAQLAELAGPGLPAVLLLAQAHAMRNRHAEAEAVLAAAEDAAAVDPLANDYLRQRAWVLHWGVHRPRDAAALLDRAESWPGQAARTGMIGRLRRSFATSDGFAEPTELPAATVSSEVQGMLAAQRAVADLLAGRGDEAAAAARVIRPPVPFRHLGDTSAFAAVSVIALESGNDWPAVEAYVAGALRDGVRTGDHDAAGLAAITLARMAFLRGRYRDATRWLAEAEVQLQRRDPFGMIVGLRAFEVGVAVFTGDFEAATSRLERLRARIEGQELLFNQVPSVKRAEGWARRLRSEAEAAEFFLRESAALSAAPAFAAQLAYEAVRAGGNAASELGAFASRCRSRFITAYAQHATAKAAHDGAGLLTAAEELAAIGALRYAVEAAGDAATAFVHDGRMDSARRASVRARELHAPDQGAELPRIDGLDATATELTARETQITGLVARGMSNAEIADRLVLSVRTVETHVYRALQKLGLNDRRELHDDARRRTPT